MILQKDAPEEFSVWALCAVGLEKILSNELKKNAFEVLESGYGRVVFSTDLPGLYRALMGLRTTDRIFLELSYFYAENFDDLFENIRNIPWESYLGPDSTLTVAKVRTKSSPLHSESTIQAMTHKAAADRLCEKYHLLRLPENGFPVEARVYIEQDRVAVLLDISGEPLFKRGYRLEGGSAPLRETTAAALLLYAGWKRKSPLYDPFCGSGTIAIEAALYAWNVAPGVGRHFALEQFRIADKNIESKIRQELTEAADFSRSIRIFASDSDSAAISYAKANLNRAFQLIHGENPESVPEFKVLPMEKAQAVDSEGFIITNPPYGLRLGEQSDAENRYREMSRLMHRFPGWKLCVLSDHAGFESFFGTKASTCRELQNGAIPLYFYQFNS
ncbi:RNA methyltransferase [Spirochaetia bacterium]|nr:RNA methyltransferase [Spirochaetia bacterium]